MFMDFPNFLLWAVYPSMTFIIYESAGRERNSSLNKLTYFLAYFYKQSRPLAEKYMPKLFPDHTKKRETLQMFSSLLIMKSKLVLEVFSFNLSTSVKYQIDNIHIQDFFKTKNSVVSAGFPMGSKFYFS